MKTIMMTKKGECYVCDKRGFTHNHHIFGSVANRKLSTKYGLMVYVCVDCHERLHNKDIELKRMLQEDGQRAFEKRHGTRQQFREIFGKNFIDEYID